MLGSSAFTISRVTVESRAEDGKFSLCTSRLFARTEQVSHESLEGLSLSPSGVELIWGY